MYEEIKEEMEQINEKLTNIQEQITSLNSEYDYLNRQLLDDDSIYDEEEIEYR